MWKDFNPIRYDREALKTYITGLDLEKLKWVKFIVLHNTSSPTIEDWMSKGESIDQRILNMQKLYEDSDHWHAGPHFFVDPIEWCGFSDIYAPGVHASCFNSRTLGIEMVGNYTTLAEQGHLIELEIDDFSSGMGGQVRDNAVYLLALLHKHLGLDPTKYQYGVSGLHFHKECKKDHHWCPGAQVIKADMVNRVAEEMKSL